MTGHRNLEQLQRYLEVSEHQILGAAAALSMLSPIGDLTTSDDERTGERQTETTLRSLN